MGGILVRPRHRAVPDARGADIDPGPASVPRARVEAVSRLLAPHTTVPVTLSCDVPAQLFRPQGGLAPGAGAGDPGTVQARIPDDPPAEPQPLRGAAKPAPGKARSVHRDRDAR